MTNAASPAKRKGSVAAKIKKWTPIYLMMLPGALYLLINNYIPMFGLVIAFKQIDFQKGIFESPWIGFQNFQFLFQTKDAFVITRNTLLYNIAFIILNTVIGIVFAIFICDITWKAGKKVYQSAILFPYLMSWVIVGYIIYAIFSMQYGIANKSILPAFGMDPLMWYNDPKYWPAILIITNTWKGIGYGCLIYISSINGIEASYFEAAELDGCSEFQFFIRIVIPLSAPIIAVLALYYGVGNWNAYFNAMIYLSDQDLFPLQVVLRSILILGDVDMTQIQNVDAVAKKQGLADLLKYAVIVVASVPVMCIYPFVQKYFVKGVMIGSIKG